MRKKDIEIIKNKKDILAIIIYKNYFPSGVDFLVRLIFPSK